MNEKKTDPFKKPPISSVDLICGTTDVVSHIKDETTRGDAETNASTDSVHATTNSHITQKLQRRSEALRENLLKRKQQLRART